MLPKNLWNPWEPRAVFPVFAEARNTLDFVAQDSLRTSLKSVARPIRDLAKRRKTLTFVWRDLYNLVLNCPIRLRGALLTRDGSFVHAWNIESDIRAGDFTTVDINSLCRKDGIVLSDGVFILIANRGRLDQWNSSPGSATVRYVGEKYIAGFRTGLFARTLNPSSGKRHFGFTGLNPQVMIGDDIEASTLLIHHSSDLNYQGVASPIIRLFRSHDDFLEAQFGDIPAFGALERRLTELFPEAREFLKPTGGRGFTVAHVKGISLASLHILRSRSGHTFGIDHSRPAHTNIIDYM